VSIVFGQKKRHPFRGGGPTMLISLDLEYDFSNKLIALAIGPVFHAVADSLVDAFVKRAKQYYGDQKPDSSA
jgi:ribosome-associated toxin RatA of RatAB toxin-antitoxin module